MIHFDQQSLERLRMLIAAARKKRRALVDMELLELSAALNLPGRLIIDLSAVDTLGHPLVVVGAPRPNLLHHLTPREREVADLVAAGLANKQIALALGISIATVKDHVHRILSKNGLPSRAAIGGAIGTHPSMDSQGRSGDLTSHP